MKQRKLRKQIDSQKLIQMYLHEKISMLQLSFIFSISPSTIKRHLLRLGIKLYNISEINKGKKRSDKSKENLSKAWTEKRRIEFKEKNSGENHPLYGMTGSLSPYYGKKHTDEWKEKMSKRMSGKNNPMYGAVGELSPFYISPELRRGTINKQLRRHFLYIEWRTDCFIRDKYTCQICKKASGRLHVDHIKPLSKIIKENNIVLLSDAISCEELWDLNNGRTLCVDCHKKTETWGGKTKI